MTEAPVPEMVPVCLPSRSPTPATRPSGRPNRQIRLPARYRDILPPTPPLLQAHEQPEEVETHKTVDLDTQVPPSPSLPISLPFQSEQNGAGVYHVYSQGVPTITPDENFTLSHVVDSPNIATDPSLRRTKASWWSCFGSACFKPIKEAATSYFAPFLNASTFLLMSWYYDGSSIKCFSELDSLVNTVIRNEDFKISDFDSNFSAAREAARIDRDRAKTSSALPFLASDGWIEGEVSIPLPCDGVKHKSESDAPHFVVKGIYYRRPLEVLKRAFTEPAVELFHITPYKEFWEPGPNQPVQRLYGETYTADYFNNEYDSLCSQPRTGPHKDLEPFIAGIILYSDSTHLTSFGDASLWPVYMYIGNQSKYIRSKPSEFGAHHLAYIPKVLVQILK